MDPKNLTVHIFNNRRELDEKLRPVPVGDFKVNLVNQRHEHANGEVHMFRLVRNHDDVCYLMALRADTVVIHGLLCAECIPQAIWHLRPKKVLFQP